MINENILSNQFNYLADHDKKFINKVKRVNGKTEERDMLNNPRGTKF